MIVRLFLRSRVKLSVISFVLYVISEEEENEKEIKASPEAKNKVAL